MVAPTSGWIRWQDLSQLALSLMGRSRPRYADKLLTNAQFKAIRATPQALVPAPGAGKAIVVEEVQIIVESAAGAYTESADNLVVEYSGGTDIMTIETTGLVDQTSTQVRVASPDRTVLRTPVTNQGVQLFNTGDGEFGGGNAANKVHIRTLYHIAPVTSALAID